MDFKAQQVTDCNHPAHVFFFGVGDALSYSEKREETDGRTSLDRMPSHPELQTPFEMHTTVSTDNLRGNDLCL